MCLIAWAVGLSSRWPLVIAANRDEYRARPTVPLTTWTTASGQTIVSGRDARAGGTWMGMTPAGRVAFLTNVREPGVADTAWRSRGELVTRWLVAQDASAPELFDALQADAGRGVAYGGFNLVVGDVVSGAWHWGSNRLNGAATAPAQWPSHPLPPGIYGLSNAALNTPWPKTTQLTAALADALARCDTQAQLEATIWSALASRERCSVQQLPATGVPQAVELALSSVCVDVPEMDYGTRSSTVLIATAPDAPAYETASGSMPWDVSVQEHTHAAGAPPLVQRVVMQWSGGRSGV